MLTLTIPFKTPYHRLPVGLKFLVLLLVTTLAFQVSSFPEQLLGLALVATLYLWPCIALQEWSQRRTFLQMGLVRVWRLWPFVVGLLLWHGLTDDLPMGLVVVARMLTLVSLANLITMTTPLSAMMAWLEHVLHPLQRLGLPLQSMIMAVVMFLRFLPSLLDRLAILQKSWRSRSTKKPNVRLTIPMVVWVLDDAEQMAKSLRARGGIDNSKTNGE